MKAFFKTSLIILIFLSSSFELLSQGNTPCTATSISSNTTCVNTAGTTASLTYQSNAANAGTPSCASPGAADGWYSFTPTVTATYTIGLTAGGITDSGMSIYTNASGCSGAFTEVECDDDDGAGSMSQIIRSLTAGTTYFIRIWSYSSGTGTFSICITQSPPPPSAPSNDDPTGATPITPAAACSYTTFTNVGATATTCGTIPAPGCASYSGGDVWFSVVVPASGGFILDSQTGGITDGGMAVYSGVPCGAMSLLYCDDDSSPNGAMPSITVAATAGSTVYIRFWEYGNDVAGTFGICATTYTPPSAPSNNNPCGATPVTVNPSSTCTSQSGGSLVGATSSTVGLGSCFGNADDDVWYSFVATSTTHTVSLNNVAGSATDLYHSVHPGPCGAIGAALVCSDPNSSTVTGLTIGTTYFIRVYSYTSGAQTTTFSVCVTSPPPAPSNDDPTGAIPITPAASCSYTNFTTVGATATSCGTIPAPGCASYSGGDVWFSVVVPASGGFILDSQTGGITDGGMAVYSGVPCGAMSLLYCDDDSSPNGSMPSLTVAATPASTVYVRFWEYGNDVAGTFGICATTYTPPPAPSNNNPCGATTVAVNPGLTCTSQANGSVVGATSSTVGIGSCFGNADDDVWYSFVATNSTHSISINNIAGSTTDMYHSVHPGPCGAIGAALVCSDANSSSVSGLSIGATYYIRVYTYTSGSQTTTFSVCVTTPAPPSANVDCLGSTPICGNASFSGNSNGEGIEEINGTNQGCIGLSGEQQSSWYTFKILTGGTLSFTITTTVDYDFAIWGAYSPTATASNICPITTTPVRCSFAASGGNTGLGNGAVDNSEGVGGNRWVAPMNVTAGEVYEMLVNNYAADLSSFTLTWGGTAVLDCSVILPLELISFTAANYNNFNSINWTLHSDIYDDYFILEHSFDGIDFNPIDTLYVLPNNNEIKTFNLKDYKIKETTYYRLKQVKKNKSFLYSKIISAQSLNENDEIIKIYPNPTKDILNIDFDSKDKNEIKISLIDNLGNEYFISKTGVDSGQSTLKINLKVYDSGIYLLKILFENSGKSEIRKIIKN